MFRRAHGATRQGRWSWRRSPDPGAGRWRGSGHTAALESFDDDHATTATGAWRAMIGHGACGQVRLVVVCRWIDLRQRRGDQLPGARDIGFSGGAGEQAVVTDRVEALWQGMEREAPDGVA